MFKAFLLKYAEIGVKGKNRYKFEDALVRQIEKALSSVDGDFEVTKFTGRIYATAKGDYDYEETVDALKKVFGIVAICPLVQIEDNGFTERVMQHLPDETFAKAHRLSTLWTLFCVIVGAVLFFVFGGWQVVVGLYEGGLRMLLGWMEVLMATAPTTEIPVNPWVVLLLVAFVLIYLPYQTGRKLSSVL